EAEKKRRESDAALKSQIEAILREHPESGDRRLEAEHRRRGMVGGRSGFGVFSTRLSFPSRER
ncbi:hypothetical protein, partial [Hydrogenibacillus schlegelii]